MTGKHLRLLIFVVVIAAAWWWWQGYNAAKPATTNSAAVRVTVAPVLRRDVPTEVSLVGTAVPRETVAVKSRLDSLVTEVLFHDGDAVKEGQPLFKLDDRELKAQIKQLEASLAKEKAQLADNKLQNERMQKLIKANAISQAQADDAKAAYETQAAQVGVAKATLDNTVVQLTYTIITAPINGRTGTINVTLGNNVKANDTSPLVVINQISPIRVQFAIPQRYYAQVQDAMKGNNGLAVSATQAGGASIIEGKLEYIDNNIDTSTGTFAARASFANENEALWPGMFVNITLELGMQKQVLTIPAVAVQGDDKNHFVFALDTTHKKAVRTPVDVETSGELSVVGKGLNEGDQVITDGILRLNDGTVVDVISPDEKKPNAPTPP